MRGFCRAGVLSVITATSVRATAAQTVDLSKNVLVANTPRLTFPFPRYLDNIVDQVTRGSDGLQQVKGDAQISFLILRNGAIRDIRFVKRSGSFSLDLSLQNAVGRAGELRAFGPLPAEWDSDVLSVTLSLHVRSPGGEFAQPADRDTLKPPQAAETLTWSDYDRAIADDQKAEIARQKAAAGRERQAAQAKDGSHPSETLVAKVSGSRGEPQSVYRDDCGDGAGVLGEPAAHQRNVDGSRFFGTMGVLISVCVSRR